MKNYFLTYRETEIVIELFKTGEKNKVIASKLGIAEHTVDGVFSNVYEKLFVKSKTQLLAKYAKDYNRSLNDNRSIDQKS